MALPVGTPCCRREILPKRNDCVCLAGNCAPCFLRPGLGNDAITAVFERSLRMRLIHHVSAVLAIFTLVNAAAAFGPCCGSHSPFSGRGLDGGYSVPACGGYACGLAPGCCDLPPSCCTNVWAGYCSERRGCGFGYGYGYSIGRHSGCCQPYAGCGVPSGGAACGCSSPGIPISEGANEPTPASAPAPPDAI